MSNNDLQNSIKKTKDRATRTPQTTGMNSGAKRIKVRGVKVMVFNATFSNISVLSWPSVLLVVKTGENHQPVASH